MSVCCGYVSPIPIGAFSIFPSTHLIFFLFKATLLYFFFCFDRFFFLLVRVRILKSFSSPSHPLLCPLSTHLHSIGSVWENITDKCPSKMRGKLFYCYSFPIYLSVFNFRRRKCVKESLRYSFDGMCGTSVAGYTNWRVLNCAHWLPVIFIHRCLSEKSVLSRNPFGIIPLTWHYGLGMPLVLNHAL